MKKFITSSLVTITALSGLVGTVGSVSASTIQVPESKISSSVNIQDEFSTFDFFEAPGNYEKYIGAEPLANNVVDHKLTNETTTMKLPKINNTSEYTWKLVTIDDGIGHRLVTAPISADGSASLDVSKLNLEQYHNFTVNVVGDNGEYEFDAPVFFF